MTKDNIAYGGQAVIGGVLIQSPKGWSLAVRDQKNQIHNYFEPRTPLTQREWNMEDPFHKRCRSFSRLFICWLQRNITFRYFILWGTRRRESF